eukprot:CAMPEP_0117655354 /NCGR_PEP_ID=MMETSP0804-20121206/4234_1 /TAXON_ID=1074897 /ORGANISM="Tetraselmis astigmatica, Strain CCMP880" /LENGTH=138 /DNA_ID=CAMNT_0005461699 /DNA_START=662 /DNA_END=1078 /DNA_ORIENTATION=+
MPLMSLQEPQVAGKTVQHPGVPVPAAWVFASQGMNRTHDEESEAYNQGEANEAPDGADGDVQNIGGRHLVVPGAGVHKAGGLQSPGNVVGDGAEEGAAILRAGQVRVAHQVQQLQAGHSAQALGDGSGQGVASKLKAL